MTAKKGLLKDPKRPASYQSICPNRRCESAAALAISTPSGRRTTPWHKGNKNKTYPRTNFQATTGSCSQQPTHRYIHEQRIKKSPKAGWSKKPSKLAFCKLGVMIRLRVLRCVGIQKELSPLFLQAWWHHETWEIRSCTSSPLDEKFPTTPFSRSVCVAPDYSRDKKRFGTSSY